MANISKNNIITVNRGDSFKFPFMITIGDAVNYFVYDLMPGDKLYLAVMEGNQKWEDALIKQTYISDDYDYRTHQVMIRFEIEDTEYLIPGTYYYQMKLYRPKENVDDKFEAVDTVMPRTKFIILP